MSLANQDNAEHLRARWRVGQEAGLETRVGLQPCGSQTDRPALEGDGIPPTRDGAGDSSRFCSFVFFSNRLYAKFGINV